MMDVTMQTKVEVTTKVVISFVPTHKLEVSDLAVSMANTDEDLICSTWKKINSKKENLMTNKGFLSSFVCLIPVTNKLCVVTFIDGSATLYYCLSNSLIFKNI